jgi:hypothetical protein
MKYKIGLILIVLSCILPLLAFIVPFLGLSTDLTVFFAGIFVVGGPELLFFTGLILAGREAAQMVKKKMFKPAGKIRYRTGLIIFIISVLLNWVTAYLEVTNVLAMDYHAKLYLMAGLDLILILSVFVMGSEFFIKFKRIFVWEGVKQN